MTGANGKPLAAWTYSNAELFDLEYEALFLRRWQFAGHEDEVRGPGDYLTVDLGRDNIIVLRDKDGVLRAFKNVCRHRASRVLEGAGTCRGVVRCPYHGWTYRLDGTLMAIPQEQNFPDLDRSQYGLHEVELEIFHGFLFVRVIPGGMSVADQFADTAHFFEKYGVAGYEQIQQPKSQVWDVNWKVAWDNYQENYHIPIGHPGLNRLVRDSGEWVELDTLVTYGVFELKDKLSKVDVEREYQELVHHADQRVPDDLKRKWVQFSFEASLGIDFYAEMLDIFQLIPVAVDKTIVRASFYGHKNATDEEQQLRRLNMTINDSVNDEDQVLCARVQQGLQVHGYEPGPLSAEESSVLLFHNAVRDAVPVAALGEAPAMGMVAAENARLTDVTRE